MTLFEYALLTFVVLLVSGRLLFEFSQRGLTAIQTGELHIAYRKSRGKTYWIYLGIGVCAVLVASFIPRYGFLVADIVFFSIAFVFVYSEIKAVREVGRLDLPRRSQVLVRSCAAASCMAVVGAVAALGLYDLLNYLKTWP